jgi:hypothetical protein
MGATKRRQAGEGGISEYLTKAGPRFLIKYPAVPPRVQWRLGTDAATVVAAVLCR